MRFYQYLSITSFYKLEFVNILYFNLIFRQYDFSNNNALIAIDANASIHITNSIFNTF